MSDPKTILVTGGTGNQGGAVARCLSQKGFTVKVLTRNPESPKALALKNMNIELIKGDLNDPQTYLGVLQDVYGVFSVQTFMNGVDKEIKQGTSLAESAMEAGVKHFVYSSASGAEMNSGVPQFESKMLIEKQIQKLGLPYTIIRPASFYENFLIPQVRNAILKGNLLQSISKETVLQYISVDDIGKAVSVIFENPAGYMGKELTIAAEQMSVEEVTRVFSETLGRSITYKSVPDIITRIFMGKNLYRMFKWVDAHSAPSVKIVESTKKQFPDIVSLKDWIIKNFKP